jgi:4'-phosphopantetheinyl transferase
VGSVAGEVHIWVADHRVGESELAACLEVLDPAERDQAGRFRFPKDHRRFVVGHAYLRLILGYYASTDPKSLRIARRCAVCGAEDHGKPYLEPPGGTPSDVRFNPSYSDHVVVVAVARGCEVGVDVERIDPGIGWREIAGYAFSTAERDSLSALDDDSALHAFYRTWTRKEAVSKASGEGLSLLPEMGSYSWDFDAPAGSFEASDTDRARSWAGHDIDLPESHMAAVAVSGPASAHEWLVRSIPRDAGESLVAGLAGSAGPPFFIEQRIG